MLSAAWVFAVCHHQAPLPQGHTSGYSQRRHHWADKAVWKGAAPTCIAAALLYVAPMLHLTRHPPQSSPCVQAPEPAPYPFSPACLPPPSLTTCPEPLLLQVDEAEQQGKAVILVNPVLKDIPSAAGVMGVRSTLCFHSSSSNILLPPLQALAPPDTPPCFKLPSMQVCMLQSCPVPALLTDWVLDSYLCLSVLHLLFNNGLMYIKPAHPCSSSCPCLFFLLCGAALAFKGHCSLPRLPTFNSGYTTRVMQAVSRSGHVQQLPACMHDAQLTYLKTWACL